MNVAALKTIGVFALLGAVVGDVLSSLISPFFFTWYNTGGIGGTQAICDTAVMTKAIFNQLIRAQLTGAAIGAVVFIVLGVLLVRRRSRNVPVAPAA